MQQTSTFAVAADPPGHRERKKAETRRAIAEVALQLALERGPDAITVGDIAAAANVSPRTVFNYFGSKDEAILGIDPEGRADLCAQVLSRPSSEQPLEALAAVFKGILSGRDDLARVWRLRSTLVARHAQLRMAQAASQSAMETELAAVIAARTGLPAEHPYCHLVVAASLLAFRSAVSRSALAGSQTLRRDLEEGFATLARGLTPPTDRRGK